MTPKKWEQFFDLVKEIVNEESSHGEKKAEVMKQAELMYASSELDEFLGWFDGLLQEENS